LAHLGAIQDAIPWQHGPACGAVWPVSHVARRWGSARALGTTRAGTRALGHGMARGIAPGSRLAAGRLALAHAAGDVLGCDTGEAEARSENLAGLAGAHARRADRLCAPRHKTPPARLFVAAVPRSSWAGTPHALAAVGSQRAGNTGQLQMGSGFRGDADGPPGSSAGCPGPRHAPRPVAAQVAQLQGRLGVTALPCVGDWGLRTGQQGAARAQHGFHSMTALPKPQRDTRRRTGPLPMDLCDQAWAEVLPGEGRRSVRRRHPGRAHAGRATRHAPLATRQALVATHPPARADHPRAHGQGAGQTLVARATTRRSADGVARTREERTRTLTVQPRAQHAAARRDGCSGLQPELTPAPAPQALGQDRDTALASVAQAWRSGTTVPLAVRPLFLRLAERTRAPAVVGLLASQIMRARASCWRACDVTVAAGLHALTTRCLVAGAPPPAPSSPGLPTPRDALARCLHRAAIQLPKACALAGGRVSTKKNLQSARMLQCLQLLNSLLALWIGGEDPI